MDNPDESENTLQDTSSSAIAWNEFDELTLSVMSNRNHYDKYLKSKTQAQTLADIFSKEQAYYKERIIDMTRDLFDANVKNDDSDVNDSYHEYMKCCIRYLKWKDVTEMIQKDKFGIEDAVSNARQELDKRIQDALLPEPAPESKQPVSDYNEKDRLISFANKMCIRKRSMDDFIVMTPAPVEKSINLPQIRDYHGEIQKRTEEKISE